MLGTLSQSYLNCQVWDLILPYLQTNKLSQMLSEDSRFLDRG